MARLKSFKIDTDGEIARALLKPGTETRRVFQARANLVRAHYLREYAKSAPSRASSVFEQKDQKSITDPKAFSAKFINGEMIIEIVAPAAEFAETGNEPGPEGDLMRIRVKSSKVKRKKGKRGKTTLSLSSGSKVVKRGNKFYIFTRRVEPTKGYGLLRKAIRTAFRSL